MVDHGWTLFVLTLPYIFTCAGVKDDNDDDSDCMNNKVDDNDDSGWPEVADRVWALMTLTPGLLG